MIIRRGGRCDDGAAGRDQGRLFYEFRLEDRIPENHLLRRMNVFVTVALADFHKELKPHYSDIAPFCRETASSEKSNATVVKNQRKLGH